MTFITQEEKQILLKDLCARLSYGVLFMVPDINEPVELLSINPKRDKPLEIDDGHDENSSTYWNLEDVTPYLRPISSMTVEEDCEFCRLFKCDSVNAMYGYINWVTGGSCDYDDFDIEFSKLAKIIDWLNTHHFDYRGLIEKGLALEAPEGMYNI